MDGLFLIHKDAGPTSFDVVRQVKRIARTGKVGHAGTLDPDATGVLVVAVGRATRFLRYLVSDAKAYEFEVVLGSSTNTDDDSGETLERAPFDHVTHGMVVDVAEGFLGTIQQVPPAFSAVHVDGKRAYALARAGKEVVLEPRQVEVRELAVIGFDQAVIRMQVACGAGTYVRSIARDLGLALGTRGHARRIHRVVSGEFAIDQCTDLDAIRAEPERFLQPMRAMLAHLPVRKVTADEAHTLSRGQFLAEDGPVDQAVYLEGSEGFLGVGRYFERDGVMLKPERMW